MKFTLISDVHIDQNPWSWDLLRDCDPSIPMIMAGDVSNDFRTTCAWLEKLHERFPKLAWVAGNHDCYSVNGNPFRTMQEIMAYYARWSERNGVCFLNKSSAMIDGINFVGCTAWHDFQAGEPSSRENQIKAWGRHMSDARYISWGDLPLNDAAEIIQEAESSAVALQKLILNDLPSVVVTHHLPHREFCVRKPDPVWNTLNGSFANTAMESVKGENILAWCFGHTHFDWDRDKDGVRYVCNPRGYSFESKNWQPQEIEI